MQPPICKFDAVAPAPKYDGGREKASHPRLPGKLISPHLTHSLFLSLFSETCYVRPKGRHNSQCAASRKNETFVGVVVVVFGRVWGCKQQILLLLPRSADSRGFCSPPFLTCAAAAGIDGVVVIAHTTRTNLHCIGTVFWNANASPPDFTNSLLLWSCFFPFPSLPGSIATSKKLFFLFFPSSLCF